MPAGEGIPILVFCFPRACRIGAGCHVYVSGHIVLAGATRVLVAESPAVGGAEASNDPAIFYRRLKKSYGLLFVGGAGAGSGS